MSSLIGFLTELLRFVSGIFTRRRDRVDRIMSQIEDTKKRLVLALEEGRVTDVAILKKQLDRLEKELSSKGRSIICAVLAASAAFAPSGCMSIGRGRTESTVFVVGDRINLVSPGETVVVPELTSPAKQWYLVDNVGLQHWLGIAVDLKDREVLKKTD